MLKDTFNREDDVISCELLCPVSLCTVKFHVSYKRYKLSSPKKDPTSVRYAASKWHTASVERHILKYHAGGGPTIAVDISGDTNADTVSENNPPDGSIVTVPDSSLIQMDSIEAQQEDNNFPPSNEYDPSTEIVYQNASGNEGNRLEICEAVQSTYTLVHRKRRKSY